MPGGDNTGPAGKGPMTGRGAGYCNGSDQAGFEAPRSGRGFGMGRGRGRGRGGGQGFGRGRGLGWCGGHQQELDALKRRAQHVSLALEELQAQIHELESDKPKAE